MRLVIVVFLSAASLSAWAAPPSEEEFNGPFASWADAQRDYIRPARAAGRCVADVAPCLQQALDDLGRPGHGVVLYLPNGDYPIGTTLRVVNRSGISIIGQDPAHTRIVYNGDPGDGTVAHPGAMILFSGVNYSRMGRLTWAGQGRAAFGVVHRWQSYGSNEPFPSHFEHADEVFADMGTGIQGGGFNAPGDNPGDPPKQSSQSETLVIRCAFTNITGTGVYLADFNSLNWWVRDSLFSKNAQAITVGAGQVFVYGSTFLRNGIDVAANNTGPVSVRDSYSKGSGTFFSLGFTGAQFNVVLQNNLVVDPSNAAVSDGSSTALTLLDNRFRGANATIQRYAYNPATTLSVGNRFGAAAPFPFDTKKYHLRSVADHAGDGTIVDATPVLPGAPPQKPRKLFDVPPSTMTGAAIQAAIDAAQAANGQRPVVHISQPVIAADGSRASYQLAKTLTVPAGSDVQIIGDGPFFASPSVLQGANASVKTVLRLEGPSRAVLKDFTVNAARDGANLPIGLGIWATNADQPGGRVFLEWLSGEGNPNTAGMDIKQLDQTTIEAHTTLFGAQAFGVSAAGGPRLKAGQEAPARILFLGGAPGVSPMPSFILRDGARMVVQDYWFESGGGDVLADLAGPVQFSLASSSSGQTNPSPSFFKLRDVSGPVTLLNYSLTNASVAVAGSAPKFAVMQSELSGQATIPTTALRVGNQRENDVILADTPAVADADILAALQPLRAAHAATTLPATPVGATDLRLYRVGINAAGLQLRIQGGP